MFWYTLLVLIVGMIIGFFLFAYLAYRYAQKNAENTSA